MIEKEAKDRNELERFLNIPEYKYLSKLIEHKTTNNEDINSIFD